MTLKLHKLDNGLTVITDDIPHLESVSYDLFTVGGYIHEKSDLLGEGSLLSELLGRGAGDYNAEELTDAFEREGIRHHERCDSSFFALHGECLRESLNEGLRLLSLQVDNPTFLVEHLEAVKSILLQEIKSLPDFPSRLLSIEASRRYFPSPFNRSGYGTETGLKSCTRDSVIRMHKECFTPDRGVISIAGKNVGEEALELVTKYFGKWKKAEALKKPEMKEVSLGTHHIKMDSAQTYLSFLFPSVPFGDPNYYVVKVLNEILSGGTFGRLFLEVREKRGLCYSVYSQHFATPERGTFSIFAGTTPDRASETASVIQQELENLSISLTTEEVARAKLNLEAGIVMGEEGSSARSGSNALDWWRGGRIRPLEELQKEIDAVSKEKILSYLGTDPFAKRFFYLSWNERG